MQLPLELDITLDERVQQLQPLGSLVCTEMVNHVNAICVRKAIVIDFNNANFRLEKDPYSGSFSLEGKWLNEHQQSTGSIIFHEDGTFFAEYDVIEDHPTKKLFFIEAVTAWGRDENIKVELRLIEKV